MNEFIKKRTDSIEKNLDEIIKKASIANNEKVKPYKKDINNALKVIENYIISKLMQKKINSIMYAYFRCPL